ncbi:sugar ABC transporter substrate-binding protein [Streptomyces mashuensis]|uniref:Sugar ABC transporter substrate-binding protein n=1 Tax=Streptomyces mashuensis TaxID=33904 RepID=A0A919EE31_9ACTN|nr:extracellular solute-binding protein [Streptomyces mashuensis]GHF50350.1 sugar ABC transporter substrate-binding protein [Streptomyces mashuensis]
MRPTRLVPLVVLTVVAVLSGGLTGCGSGTDPDTLKVAYQRSTDNKVQIMDGWLAGIKKQFEREHPGRKLRLIPIQASLDDYYAKVQQMMRSPRTAPDVVHEDTFLINSDITSGYLRPLDDELAGWKDWNRFAATAKAAARGTDGRTYGVPDGTDTRGLWFNKEILARAGLPADWHPRTWDDVLDAARAVKRAVPGVIPLNVYSGKGAGEATSMQGFEMLLYGTGADPLYAPAEKKWVTGSRGFRDALAFVRTVYAEKLGPEPSDALDPKVTDRVVGEWLPEGRLAIALDGSWLGKFWQPNGSRPWPRWPQVMGRAAFPTQDGHAPGRVSLCGGWTWSISAKSGKPGLAWQLIETMQTPANATAWAVADGQIAVRDDVAADPAYRTALPGTDFFTELVQVSAYRPALPAYAQVSHAIQEATESVTTGDADPATAARRYDERLASIAGASGVTRR